MKAGIFCVLVLLTCFAFVSAQWSEDTVTVESGTMAGVITEKARWFKGIPFAEPPIGSLRFESPVPYGTWEGIFQADITMPGCPQICILPPSLCPTNQSEDCLYLTVVTPRMPTQSSPNWPVMVFIAGGAYVQGSGFVPLYDGEYIANYTDTVVVTFNYRLGALGFLASPPGIPGNYGLQDQRVVLQWVQANIAAFGGNPNLVTLFGESAGGGSVGVHMISPLSKGLFQQAIMESNPICLWNKTPNLAMSYADEFASYLNCTRGNLECMKSASLEDIVNATNAVGLVIPDIFKTSFLETILQWTPVLAPDEVPAQTLDAFASGDFADIPFMVGSNGAEGIMFILGFIGQALPGGGPINLFEYGGLIAALFQEQAPDVLLQYPCSNPDDCSMVMSQLTTDYVFTCPSRYLAGIVSNSSQNAYWYLFNHTLSFDAWGPNFNFCDPYACHGAELPFVFGSVTDAGYVFDPEEATLSQSMMDFWTNFAHTGNPNSGPGPANWPLFNSQSRPGNLLETPSTTPTVGLQSSVCEFWDSLGYIY